MAEAQPFVAFAHARRGAAAHVTNDGLIVRLTCVIPSPAAALRAVRRAVQRTRLAVAYAAYPLSSTAGFVALSAACALALTRVTAASVLVPVSLRLPLPLRSAPTMVVAVALAAALLLLAAALQRVALACLLRDRAFFRQARAPSLRTRVWVGLVRALTGGVPRTETFQSSLPRQGVPALTATVRRYLVSVRNLQSDDEYTATVVDADDFLASVGPSLQRLLVVKSLIMHPHSDLWLKYVYLRGRAPLSIGSNS
jgi:hypothetical protein